MNVTSEILQNVEMPSPSGGVFTRSGELELVFVTFSGVIGKQGNGNYSYNRTGLVVAFEDS